MTAHHCPECLSRDGVFRLTSPGIPCSRCERVPEIQLTPREIRLCLGVGDKGRGRVL